MIDVELILEGTLSSRAWKPSPVPRCCCAVCIAHWSPRTSWRRRSFLREGPGPSCGRAAKWQSHVETIRIASEYIQTLLLFYVDIAYTYLTLLDIYVNCSISIALQYLHMCRIPWYEIVSPEVGASKAFGREPNPAAAGRQPRPGLHCGARFNAGLIRHLGSRVFQGSPALRDLVQEVVRDKAEAQSTCKAFA